MKSLFFNFQVISQVLFVSCQLLYPDDSQLHQYTYQQRPTPPRRPQPYSNNDSKRISELKCDEYGKLSYSLVQSAGLAIGRRKTQGHRNYHCDSTTGLIVGGIKAKPGDFPHMAAIGFRNLNGVLSFHCGGSLISERFVLTAAHCRRLGTVEASIVRLGALDLSSSSQAKDYTIEKFIKHEDYDSFTKFNDIAVVKLSRDVEFGSLLRPACLWQTANIESKKVIASGWGATEYAGSASSVLMKVSLDLISNNVCALNYEDEYEITQNQVCSGVLTGGKDTCQGDSGGPIQISMKENPCLSYIIGITSYGSYCGAANSPGIYTRISSYIDWIEDKVWK